LRTAGIPGPLGGADQEHRCPWNVGSNGNTKTPGRCRMSEINSDEKVVVARSVFNVANIIAAIALLILVVGLLKFIGVSVF
jgi:hypothetical protein